MKQELVLMETVLDRIQDGVILFDSEHRLLLVNRSARTIFKLDRTTPVLGEPFHMFFSQPELLALVEDNSPNPEGWCEYAVSPEAVFSVQIASVEGQNRAITLHDISYMKRIDHIKSDFVNTVSHDLRSPLTAIMGYVELIERAGPVNERQQDFIRRIIVSVRNITTLIDDLLYLGRIEAGFDLRRERILISSLVQYAIEGFSGQIEKKGLHLHTETCEAVLYVDGNPVQLRQMLDNLLENAIKYTPPGGEINIRCSLEQKQIILQVQDSGIGIPPAEINLIFDKFYRASNVDSAIVGTGLGLAIVHSVVDNHNGRIWVDSVPNRQTTFTVVLPMAEDKQQKTT